MNAESAFSMNRILEVGEIIKKKNLTYANEVATPAHPRNTFYTKYIKRWIDFVIALAALIITAPINLLLGVATYFDVGRPVIFRQMRTGKDKRCFEIVKFRNMTNEKDARGELLPPEQRVTRFGRFVRRTSLDELLNFWLVLKGDMSIIGPRPLHCFYTDWMTERHAARYAVRPGLECPMLGAYMTSTNWQDRFENDVWYVENCSFWTDVRLFFRLIHITIFPQNKEERETSAGAFIGYDEKGMAISVNELPDVYKGDRESA